MAKSLKILIAEKNNFENCLLKIFILKLIWFKSIQAYAVPRIRQTTIKLNAFVLSLVQQTRII